MDMYKLKFTKLQNEIFRLLCIKTGIYLNQRTISKMLNVSATAIAKSIFLLEKERLIKIEKNKKMNLVSIKLNNDNPKVMELKRVENLKLFYESGLNDSLEENFPGTTIILFGSYSRGDDTINSDIDIAIINTKEKKLELDKYETLLERKIYLHFYRSFKDINKELKENIFNGIILAGSIEL
jgi:predicted nucleotidyltransferase